MRVRYKGPLPRVDLALPGALIACDRGEWFDLAAACDDAGISTSHAAIAVRGMKASPDWEIETTKADKATKAAPRAAKG